MDPQTPIRDSAYESSPVPVTSNINRNPRSCISCYRRKVRCNKKLPCAHCARAGWTCTYPSKERETPKKTLTLEDINTRLDRLEAILVESLGRKTDGDQNQQPSPAKNLKTVPGTYVQPASRQPGSKLWEALLKDGDLVHYVDNSNLLEVFQDEERISPPELQKSHDNEPRRPESPNLNLTFGLSPIAFGSKQSPQQPHPDAQLALRLWTAYVENVDPVLKILHIPTTQSAMIAVISGSKQINPSLEALAFAIYFAAVTSLSEDRLATLTTETPRALLQAYRTGLDQAIVKANLLNKPNVMLLQALAIFATCVRVYDNSRAVWVLVGTAIRLAQSIGIHRDGASLKLSPFESELRLRLWWHLCLLDSRSPEDHGFAHTIENLDQGMRLPLNTDDAQLFPEMKALPADSEGWTDMSFPLVQIEAGRLLHRVLDGRQRVEDQTERDISSRRDVIQIHNNWVKSKFFNRPISSDLQQVALVHYDTACAKMDFMLQIREELYASRNSEQPEGFLKGLGVKPFLTACHTLESSYTLLSGEISIRFTWVFKVYTQWYALAYVLRYLCAFPSAPKAEEAWVLVDRVLSALPYADNLPANELTRKTAGASIIWTCLVLLRRRALEARAADRAQMSQVPVDASRRNSNTGSHSSGSAERTSTPYNCQVSRATLQQDALPQECGNDVPPIRENGGVGGFDSMAESNTQLTSNPLWQDEFMTFNQSAMPEMLYLPEWSDIVNQGLGFNGS